MFLFINFLLFVTDSSVGSVKRESVKNVYIVDRDELRHMRMIFVMK